MQEIKPLPFAPRLSSPKSSASAPLLGSPLHVSSACAVHYTTKGKLISILPHFLYSTTVTTTPAVLSHSSNRRSKTS